MKKKQIYVVVNKKTREAENILIKDWYFVPMFEKKKSAVEFMGEQLAPDYLKVIKCELKYDK